MLDQGIIERSNSPWMAPAVYTLKPSGEVRICADCRELNKRTRKDAYPPPLPDDIFDRITDAKAFSILDMQSGFWQIPMSPQDVEKTAFSPGPDMGVYQFKRMPFGLTGAQSTFQRMMDTILNGLDFAAVYLDDIIIFSPDHRTRTLDLQAVLQKLADVGLTLRGSKCRIGVTAVQYLGHVFSANGIAPNPSKVAVIESWPVPSGYATISEPLYNLLREGTAFQWTNTSQIAFDHLKERLTTAPFLTPPNFHRPFELMTDANEFSEALTIEVWARKAVDNRQTATPSLRIAELPSEKSVACKFVALVQEVRLACILDYYLSAAQKQMEKTSLRLTFTVKASFTCATAGRWLDMLNDCANASPLTDACVMHYASLDIARKGKRYFSQLWVCPALVGGKEAQEKKRSLRLQTLVLLYSPKKNSLIVINYDPVYWVLSHLRTGSLHQVSKRRSRSSLFVPNRSHNRTLNDQIATFLACEPLPPIGCTHATEGLLAGATYSHRGFGELSRRADEFEWFGGGFRSRNDVPSNSQIASFNGAH
uniref:Reverse transcriptase domain-containing protein n=1 Tax=Trichuris muris TaxID=70415 RepID=A0A5S6R1Y7_TRIMR